jgi:uncharacterized protein
MTRFRSYILFAFLLLSQLTFAQLKVPALWNLRVHDDAKVLSQQTIDYLESRLKTFEDSTSNQIAILIVPSLEGEVIEEYGLKVAEAWKLGTSGKDNGIIILVSIGDHKMRIEVGQGLEGPLPDAMTNRIIRNEMAPAFRRGDYDGGMIAATNAVIAATKGEYKGEGIRGGRTSGKGRFPIWLIVFVIIGIISMFSKRNGGGRTGGWSSGGGFFMGGGGGSWGGGGGGGGFSGGGGSFGGGGSSGSW